MSKENSTNKITSDENCYRYLLGEMNETEQFEFDDVCFGNDDYLVKLESIREELIDKYINNGLSAGERKSFENYFLLSPYHKKKLEFSKNLSIVISEKTNEGKSFLGFLQTPFSFLSDFFISLSLGKAAAVFASLLIFVGCLWLITLWVSNQSSGTVAGKPDDENIRELENANIMVPPVTPLSENEKTPGNEQNSKNSDNLPEKSPSPKTNLPENTRQDKKKTPSPKRQNNANSAREIPQSKPVIITFIPIPGFRSEGNEESLVINKGVEFVRFQVDAPKDRSKSYFVWIRTAENQEVWKKPISKAKAEKISITVPTSVFSSDDYKLEIFEKGNAEERISAYPFRVKKN